jgi:hypothetical protein
MWTIILYSVAIVILVLIIIHRIRKAQRDKIEKESIFLDAKTNRIIAETSSNIGIEEDFKPLFRAINRAAKIGQTKLIINPANDFNQKICYKYSKSEIREMFESMGYKIDFRYSHLSDASIREVRW